MLRALFFREFRKSFVAHGGILGTILGLLMAFERLAPRMGMGKVANAEIINVFLLGAVVASGLIAGERCFSANFKENRYLFLVALPVSRVCLGTSLFSSRLLGAWTAILTVLAFRMTWAAWLPPEIAEDRLLLFILVSTLLTFHLISFMTGTALALSVRRELFVYLAGLPLLAFLIATAGTNLSYGFDSDAEGGVLRILMRIIVLGIVAAFLLAAITVWSFVRGEFDRWYRRLCALALVALLAAGHLIFSHLMALNPFLASLGDEWDPALEYGRFHISPDGKLIVLWEKLRYGLYSRLKILDLRTGTVLGHLEPLSLHQVQWSSTGRTLNVLTSDEPILGCVWLPCLSKSGLLRRLSRTGREIARFELDDLGTLYGYPASSYSLFTTQVYNQIKLFRIGDSGLPEVVWKGLSIGQARIDFEPWGAFLIIDEVAWKLDVEGHVVGKSGDPEALRAAYATSNEATRKSQPFQVGRQLFGSYWGTYGAARYGTFYLEEMKQDRSVNLWLFDRFGAWIKVLSNLPYDGSGSSVGVIVNSLRGIKPEHRPVIYPPLGTVAFIDSSSGSDSVGVFSPELRRRMPVSATCLSAEKGKVGYEVAWREDVVLIRFSCGRGEIWKNRFFLYRRGANQIREIEGLPIDLPADREWLYLGDDGFVVWSVADEEIWSLSPGSSPRRIWPVSES